MTWSSRCQPSRLTVAVASGKRRPSIGARSHQRAMRIASTWPWAKTAALPDSSSSSTGEEAIDTRPDGGDRLAALHRVGPDGPGRFRLADLERRATFVDAVVPLDEIAVDDNPTNRFDELGCLTRTPERTGVGAGDAPAIERPRHVTRLLATLSGEGDVAAPGVAPGTRPRRFAMPDHEQLWPAHHAGPYPTAAASHLRRDDVNRQHSHVAIGFDATEDHLLERETELAVLGDSLADARLGHGRMVFIAGEAGAGKTSLVRSFRTSDTRRTRIMFGHCDTLSTPATARTVPRRWPRRRLAATGQRGAQPGRGLRGTRPGAVGRALGTRARGLALGG